MNQPWLAALLNFVLPGSGYIYNGKRILLGVGLVLVFGMTYVGIFTGNTGGNSSNDQHRLLNSLIGFSVIFLYFCFAQDAHSEAEEIKKQKAQLPMPLPK